MLILVSLSVVFIMVLHLCRSKVKVLPEGRSQARVRVRVVVPAFNEEANVYACLTSICDSISVDITNEVSVVVVDDSSTDNTFSEIERAQRDASFSIEVISAAARPEGWHGKNWPCHLGAMAEGPWDYALFIDSDVRLKEGAISALSARMKKSNVGLLSMLPRLGTKTIGEKLIQPLMFDMMSLLFAENKPFAAGPLMMFSKTSYDASGGYRSVKHEVVEDQALARLIDDHGFRVEAKWGTSFAQLDMYDSFSDLFEGWTKNIFIGLNRSLVKLFAIASLIAMVYIAPLITASFFGATTLALIYALSWFRRWGTRRFMEPTGLLSPIYELIGAPLLVFMMLVSCYRTTTGRGWTWKGRPLKGLNIEHE